MSCFRQCHVRLLHPEFTNQLAAHFSSNGIIQTSGLDNIGTELGAATEVQAGSKPLEVLVVEGRQEELYWAKLPENIRMQGVRVAEETADAALALRSRDAGESQRGKRGRGRGNGRG